MYLLTFSLAHSLTQSLPPSMEQGPSWEANQFSASQEIPPSLKEPEGSVPHLQVPDFIPC